jgi:hypothetical protein
VTGRITGSIMIIAAYFVVLHISVFYGAIMHFVADMICMPFYIKHKQYDVVIMLGFLMSIALSKVTLILAS